MSINPINTYEEAVELIHKVGILPLARLIPTHPSLVSVTPEKSWHTGTEFDPWRWRTRFAADGHAAYGKFLKKKAVFISRKIFPYVQEILGSERAISARYKDGMVTEPAVRLFDIIQEEPGVETRALRLKAGLQNKDSKKRYDHGINELQGSLDIVIAGVSEKKNRLGDISGWSSTSFQTAEQWMQENRIKRSQVGEEKAREKLYSHLEAVCQPEAITFLKKLL
ncbi:hypothetical protein [Bacillus horti]|uniref:Uncharacterized protein n=1 Tax=Caldalkalibacillus horti TaxID=77523 RepID=A0ABT9VY25_9BACI|nr:hypothetical protein [Bacillus horti]MDQ0165898.1 hypothetical protein [Bacillus horti]